MADFTLGSMYWINPKYSLDDFRADMQRVKENRITLLRISVLWEYVEVERNKFDFSVYDTFFRAAEEAGIKVMLTLLFYLPLHRLLEQQQNGRLDVGRRYPCLDRPEIREGVELFFSETVRHYQHSPVLEIWNLWNEPTDPWCACPDSLEKFALWLKRKYPAMADLQKAWADEYAVFKPILPQSIDEITGSWLQQVFSLPLRGRDTAIRLDANEFQIENSAEHLAFLASLVRRYDALHELHTNPCCTNVNPIWSGISPWKMAEIQNSTGGSIHPHCMLAPLEDSPEKYPSAMLSVIDLTRSWTAGKDAWIGEYQAGSTFHKANAYTPGGQDISAALYHSLARGMRGLIFWEWQSWRSGIFEPGEFSLRNPSDCGPTERSEAAAQFGAFLEKYQPFLKDLALPGGQVAILHSMDEFRTNETLVRHLSGYPLQYNHFNAAYAAHQTLVRAGIPAEFVTEAQFKDNILKKYKILILPHVRTISAETAEAIKKFAAGGGAVWADGRCGLFDKHLFLRNRVPCNGLDELFGCREIDEVAPRVNDFLSLKNGTTFKACREIQRLEVYDSAEILAECSGYPAAVRNHYGKGVAELWGTYLTANRETDLSSLLVKFAVERGVAALIDTGNARELLVSMLKSDKHILAVFTSLAAAPQTVTAKLPQKADQLLNDVPVELLGEQIKLTIRPGETVPVLVSVNSK